MKPPIGFKEHLFQGQLMGVARGSAKGECGGGGGSVICRFDEKRMRTGGHPTGVAVMYIRRPHTTFS